jgi:hypothetical protein
MAGIPFLVAIRYVALGVFLAVDVYWWGRAITSPPSQRRGNTVAALLYLVPVVVALFAIAFP